MRKTLLLSQSDIQQILDMDEVLSTVDEVFRYHGNGQVIMPAKITLDLNEVGINSWTNAMPAYVRPLGASGIKWAGGYIDNPKAGLPYVVATIIIQDPYTGIQLSVMDGEYITNLRTGAVAGVVAKYFAREGASSVAIIGAGAQARTALEATVKLVSVREVRAYDIVPEIAARFAADMALAWGVTASPAETVEEAVRGADIVVTATPADEPLVRFAWLKKGSVSISLGSYQEFDEDTPLKADKVYVDSWAQCMHRGELMHIVHKGLFTEKNLTGEIGDAIVGRIPGRVRDDETILVVPIGLGSLDVAIGRKVYDKALQIGKGSYFAFT